jgi:DNA-binding HxlR family transcriptional regulator
MRKAIDKCVITTRRSPCPVSCSLDILGDKWTLLIIRDMILGSTRFKEFESSPENIPTSVLADRLYRLTENNIIKQTTSKDGSKHAAYVLTSKGNDLFAVIKNLRDWGLKWEKGTRVLLGNL